MLSGLFDNCASLVRRALPPACALCGAVASGDGLCTGCRMALPRLPALRCAVCAVPTPAGEVCGRCLQAPPRYARVAAALEYTFPVDSLVQRLKYAADLACARPLAAALADTIEHEPYPDLVIAMPIARQRLAERGFNQAAEIARLACREFGLTPRTGLVRRQRAATPQASLPWKERARNVRGVFACDADLSGMSVAVVDDVMTTGATLDELAGALRHAGAKTVTGWIAARTVVRG
jgi:ComF family protein